MMWPLTNQHRMTLPKNGEPGCFAEFRGDRLHCGVDLYSPKGSLVLAIDAGIVVQTGAFTEPQSCGYWRKTHQVIIRHDCGWFVRYAELEQVGVAIGDKLKEGAVVGRVGQVLEPCMIDDSSPQYIRELKNSGRLSMLHLEFWLDMPSEDQRYRGGNWFEATLPSGLIDPTAFLNDLMPIGINDSADRFFMQNSNF